MVITRRLERTIARETEVRGVGFFLGHDVTMRFRPAPGGSGVVFARVDLPGRPEVRACIDNVIPSPRRTTIRQGEATVELIEHVMAALAGLHIDNCLIEIDAPEAPGLDGSSQAYVQALQGAGIVELDRPRAIFVIKAPLALGEGSASLSALPMAGEPSCVLCYHLDYGPGTPIGTQSLTLAINPESFAQELAGSRTFLLEAEARALRQAGVGRRASESDLLIFGQVGVIGNALRWPDECVRHKMLDMVGDLALLERDIVGHVVAHRSGHQLNAALVRALAETFETPARRAV
jgi:UDP-3-O-[3-hydroxymyristoyl] N-acetylglucosamine deacetylase / 3-hydroxyacyl-[acyl-carrier-protein] dehydratase